MFTNESNTTPYLYRVDFYIDDKVVGSTEVRAWSRKEAWIESWSTETYKLLRDIYPWQEHRMMFDATRLERQDEI